MGIYGDRINHIIDKVESILKKRERKTWEFLEI